ncbi:MAG: hypothetical protein WCJ64_02210 [Rhodospirillaceae bacterium]
MPATEQLLMPFFTPPTPAERLSHQADQPLRPRCRQKGLTGTMFAPRPQPTHEPAAAPQGRWETRAIEERVIALMDTLTDPRHQPEARELFAEVLGAQRMALQVRKNLTAGRDPFAGAEGFRRPVRTGSPPSKWALPAKR